MSSKTKDEGTYIAEISVVGWLDFRYKIEGVTWPRVAGQTELMAEFTRWLRENEIWPAFRGGQVGPSWQMQGYSPEDANKIAQWLEDHGIEIIYPTDTPPPEGSWSFNESGEWVDHDPINPMRTPADYRLLALDEQTQPGDIMWNPAWTKWVACLRTTTPRTINIPVARKT